MRVFWVTWVLVAAIALRLISDFVSLQVATLQAVVDASAHTRPWPIVRALVIWSFHEIPQTLVYFVDVVMVEGLYRVWRNLRRLQPVLGASAT